MSRGALAATVTLGLLLMSRAKTAPGGSPSSSGGATFAQCVPSDLEAYASLIAERAQAFNVTPELLAALVQKESSGNPNATRFEPAVYSRVLAQGEATWGGALSLGWSYQMLATSIGLGQVLGETAWSDLAFHYSPSVVFDPWSNLGLAAKYLREQLDTFGGQLDLALQAYNEGPGNVQNGVSDAGYSDAVLSIYNSILSCEGAS